MNDDNDEGDAAADDDIFISIIILINIMLLPFPLTPILTRTPVVITPS